MGWSGRAAAFQGWRRGIRVRSRRVGRWPYVFGGLHAKKKAQNGYATYEQVVDAHRNEKGGGYQEAVLHANPVGPTDDKIGQYDDDGLVQNIKWINGLVDIIEDATGLIQILLPIAYGSKHPSPGHQWINAEGSKEKRVLQGMAEKGRNLDMLHMHVH